jgi:hypothetical protein
MLVPTRYFKRRKPCTLQDANIVSAVASPPDVTCVCCDEANCERNNRWAADRRGLPCDKLNEARFDGEDGKASVASGKTLGSSESADGGFECDFVSAF